MKQPQISRNDSAAFVNVNGLRFCYESFGDARSPAVVMIMGLGAQMTVWPSRLCQTIAKQGFRVIRFDNRDIGLSAKLAHLQAPAWHRIVAAGLLGLPLKAPYSLNDMVADTIGLLDALNIHRAHIVGASMGGMIGQLTAIQFPERLLSLSTIMTTSGAQGLPRGKLSLLWQLCRPRPNGEKPEAALKHLVRVCSLIGSPDFRDDENYLRERLKSDIERCYYPAGVARQTAAVATAPPRKTLLRRVHTPTLVIHGTADPIMPYQHGIDLAESIPNASLELIEGMGHDIPLSLLPRLSQRLVDHMRASDNRWNPSKNMRTIPASDAGWHAGLQLHH
jgi:pimeloyl-ACP methyl ester carboxylesterase